jgi:hypothetical protein
MSVISFTGSPNTIHETLEGAPDNVVELRQKDSIGGGLDIVTSVVVHVELQRHGEIQFHDRLETTSVEDGIVELHKHLLKLSHSTCVCVVVVANLSTKCLSHTLSQ